MKPEQSRILMQEMLDVKLYRHCLGVAEMAESLARRYGVDTDKAFVVGMIHDYGKRYSSQELLIKAGQFKLELDSITLSESKLLHASVGAALVERDLGINDPDMIRAVSYHTTGRPGMGLLEKIIYLADYIEVGRNYVGVEKIREIACTDLDRALLVAVDHTLKSILDRRLLLHPRSVAFRNSLLIEISGR